MEYVNESTEEYNSLCLEQDEISKSILAQVSHLPKIYDFIRDKLFDLEAAHNEEVSIVTESCYILGFEDREKDPARTLSSVNAQRK